MPEHFVCNQNEIAENETKIVRIDLLDIGIIYRDAKYYAYRNLCPHQGGPACEGLNLPQVVDVIDAAGLFVGQRFDENDIHIVCPWHGYEYHLETGLNVCNPKLKLQKFEIVLREGAIYVEL
ncbi:Rieske 2Fe-2S domain-containing protein [Tardiphaga sp.]|uniref:Rieske (2Fe-2S) protein n=1 Tax=Tardiphaga sp. TaxID=1926292 RepID=UPI0025EEFFF4|nr:Rieske 2Fe-2S domain-containing protein [Tardiphaga sp.]